MSEEQESDAVLRGALDAIEAIRNRLTWAGYLAVAATAGAFMWLEHIARPNANIKSLVMATVFALICVTAWSTFALAILMTRMTKRIIRAIDFASRRKQS